MHINHKKETCSCDKNHLTITKKDVGTLVLIGGFILSLTFSAGYFWGKRQTVHSANQDLQKIIALNYMWQRVPMANNDQTEQETVASAEQIKTVLPNLIEQRSEPTIAGQTPYHPSQEMWMAHLCGFGSEQAANEYRTLLKDHCIDTMVVAKTSNAAGRQRKKRTIRWYQVDTHAYPSEQELDNSLDIIHKIKPIKSKKVKVHHHDNA